MPVANCCVSIRQYSVAKWLFDCMWTQKSQVQTHVLLQRVDLEISIRSGVCTACQVLMGRYLNSYNVVTQTTITLS